MILKFLPRAQMVLLAVLVENFILFSTTLMIILLSSAVSWTAAIGLFFVTQVIHAQFLGNLRHLRFFEIMGSPEIGEAIGSRSSFIARSLWLAVWPSLPFGAALYRGLESVGFITPDNAIKITRIYLIFAGLLALPAFAYLLDAARWRLYATRHHLAAQRRPGLRIAIIGSYYFAVENWFWSSIGEEKVNQAYAMVWCSKIISQLIIALINTGPAATWQNSPKFLASVSLSSYVSLFGMCWIVAHIYHTIFTRWLYSLGVVLTTNQSQAYDMQKYDLSGHLLAFCFQAYVLSGTYKQDFDSLSRLVGFLLLYRLPKISEYTHIYSQTVSLDRTGQWSYYTRAVFQGAITPFCLGLALFLRIWRVPLSPSVLAREFWEKESRFRLPVEFELWFHTEGMMLVVDLFMGMLTGLFSTIGFTAHLFSTNALHFWHRYLGQVDYVGKFWSQIVRDLIGMFVHFIILSYIFERMWQFLVSSSFADFGFVDLVNFIIYFARYIDGNIRFSSVMQNGLTSHVVCSYRCVIQELPAPKEEAFRDWNDVCGICQSQENDRLALCEFPCFHFFHRNCIEEWLKIRMVCPMCMRKVWFDNGEVKMENIATGILVPEEPQVVE